MSTALASLGGLDWVFLLVVTASVLIGMVRGFAFECLALAGWLVAWFGGQALAPQLAPHLPVSTPGSALNLAAAMTLCFVAVLIAWSLLARMVRLLVHATPLSLPDRLLGGAFGALRAAVVLLAVAAVVALTPAAQSLAWRTSHGARWLGQSLQVLKPLTPDPAAWRVPALT